MINRFDRDWKKIEAFVGSKTVIQVYLNLIHMLQLHVQAIFLENFTAN